jgi:hypothetical protein
MCSFLPLGGGRRDDKQCEGPGLTCFLLLWWCQLGHEVNEVQCESCRTELGRALRGMLEAKGPLLLCPQIKLSPRGGAAEGGAPHSHAHPTGRGAGATNHSQSRELALLPTPTPQPQPQQEVVLASSLTKGQVDQLREMVSPAVRRAGEAASKTYEGIDEQLRQMCVGKHIGYQIPSQRITDHVTSCRESCMKATDLCHAIKSRLTQPGGEDERAMMVGWADESNGKLQQLVSFLET